MYDTGEDYVDGISIPYIVMEYVDGSTLRELLHSGRKLLPERSLEMTVGLLVAHERVVHDGDRYPGRIGLAVLRRELTPAQQRQSHRAEIPC